ncbi:lysozyme [Nostoc phage A1]|uniref:Lysozyme n=1 Tax=Nostoc phage A1 TaxID=1775256 RepID=A0ACD6B8W5_9CAUD|nr:lysozyme [Nostoc phage A1]
MQDPIIKILIGNDTFLLGQEIIDLDFQIGEGKKQNNINFTIFDKDGFFADKYISTSYAQGGIDLPIDFLENPDDAKDTNSASTATEVDSVGNGTVSRSGVFTPKIRAFLDTIASKETAPGTALNIEGYRSVSGSSTLFDESEMVAGGFPRSQGSKNIGRYQFTVIDYNHARSKYPNINNYSPQNQDLLAYFKLQHRNVLPYLLRDDLDNAIDKASYEWASFPGIGKPQGQFNQVQSGTTIASLKSYYETRLAYYRSLEAGSDFQASAPKDTTNNQYAGKEYKTIRTLSNSTTASFYGYNDGFDSSDLTANGERFNPEGITAAHESLPFGTLVKVTWAVNNKSVVVRINDRGAFVRLGRQIDLSYGAAKALSSPGNDAIAAGLLTVKLEVVELRTPIGENLKESAKNQIAENLEKIKKTRKSWQHRRYQQREHKSLWRFQLTDQRSPFSVFCTPALNITQLSAIQRLSRVNQ